jgi:hypothetical protein
MSMELTSRFLDRLRLIELITAVCILASLSFLLMAYGGENTSTSDSASAKYEPADHAALADIEPTLANTGFIVASAAVGQRITSRATVGD